MRRYHLISSLGLLRCGRYGRYCTSFRRLEFLALGRRQAGHASLGRLFDGSPQSNIEYSNVIRLHFDWIKQWLNSAIFLLDGTLRTEGDGTG